MNIAMAAMVFQGAAQPSNAADTVIVHGSRIQARVGAYNRSIRIIGAEEIRSLPVKSLAEVLAYALGVDVRQRGPWGGQADISMDGSTFDQVLVLVNGVRMSDPQTGHNMLNLPVPLTAVDHIEVIRGAAATAYGVNALAGVVNIVTLSGTKNAVVAQAYGGSSFRQDTATGHLYVGAGAQATAILNTGKAAQTLALSYDKTNGYRYNTASQAARLFYQLHTALGRKTALDATGGYVNNDFGASFFYAAPKDPEATENVQTVVGSVALKYTPAATWSIMPRLSWRYNKDEYIFIRQHPEVYRNVHEANVGTAELQATKTFTNSTLGLGAEYREDAINSNNLGHRNRANTGLYAEYRWQMSRRFHTEAGLYANYNTDYGLRLYPGLNFGYMPAAGWKLFVNASAGQRLPTYTDLYYKGPTNIGNDALKPEEAWYGEAGLKYTTPTQRWTAQYAYRHITDFIDWVRGDLASAWQPQNFGTMNTQILSLSTEQSLDGLLGQPATLHLRFNAGWNYLSPRRSGVSNVFSKYNTDALRHQAVAGISGSTGHFSARFSARYLQRINSGDYTLLDLHLQYNAGQLQGFADFNNLTDKQYTEAGAAPLPGRWLSLGLRYATL